MSLLTICILLYCINTVVLVSIYNFTKVFADDGGKRLVRYSIISYVLCALVPVVAFVCNATDTHKIATYDLVKLEDGNLATSIDKYGHLYVHYIDDKAKLHEVSLPGSDVYIGEDHREDCVEVWSREFLFIKETFNHVYLNKYKDMKGET